MSKPDDIPQDVWDAARPYADELHLPNDYMHGESRKVISRAIVAERQASAVDGWNACRRSIYAVCEDVIEEYEQHRSDADNAPRHHFGRGGMSAAKSIARGFNSMEALDDDNLVAAIRKRGEA